MNERRETFRSFSFQIYEVVMHFTGHQDHNIVTASLECLQQLLKNGPTELHTLLMRPGAIKHTSIYPDDVDSAKAASGDN